MPWFLINIAFASFLLILLPPFIYYLHDLQIVQRSEPKVFLWSLCRPIDYRKPLILLIISPAAELKLLLIVSAFTPPFFFITIILYHTFSQNAILFGKLFNKYAIL